MFISDLHFLMCIQLARHQVSLRPLSLFRNYLDVEN